MKKIILFLLLSLSGIAFSQTTIEEYNYLTKGYKIQQESGLDMKRGYELQHLFDFKEGDSYFFRYSVLLTDAKLCGVLVEIVSTAGFSTNKYYLCIPFGNDTLMSKYDSSIASFDSGILRAYNNGMSRLFSNVLYNSLVSEMNKPIANKK